MSTTVHPLTAGHADERVASSVTLVRDGDALIVADPGMVASRARILDPLAWDQAKLEGGRERLLAGGVDIVIPGHGAPFRLR